MNVHHLSSFLVQHVCNHTYNFQSNNRFRLAKSCKIQAANPSFTTLIILNTHNVYKCNHSKKSV
nr:MAG TPA: hypothetical protein [Caudoviricetes sp.]